MTEYYNFYGKSYWAKVHTPDPEYQTYTLDAYLDDKSFNLLAKTGLELKIREGTIGDETKEYVKFRRPVSKVIKGKLVEFGPVPVEDAQGKKITALVGNGSDCIFFVSIYPTKKGPGHRLDKLVVTNLVEYKGAQVHDAHSLPAEAKAEPAKASRKTATINEDEIPF